MLPPDTEETAEGSPASPAAEAQEPDEYDESECAKIKQFEKLLVIPRHFEVIYSRYQEDRDYISTSCLPSVVDDEDTVSTNFILRNQYTLVGQIYARDPKPEIRPKQIIGQAPPGLLEFARSTELVANRLADESGLKAKINGALQDVQTQGVAWLKITTQQDIYKDPLGCTRQNDQLDNIARLRTLLDGFGAGDFDENSADYFDLIQLSDTVRTYLVGQAKEQMAQQAPPPASGMQGQPPVDPAMGDPAVADQQQQLDSLQGGQGAPLAPSMLPEVPVFIGVNIDPVLPDDMRVDWDITRPEDIYQSKWIAHRVFMYTEEIADRWHVPSEDLAKARTEPRMRSTSGSTAGDENPSDRTDIEKDRSNDRIAVWEIWDKVAGRRYVWVTGMDRFVVNEVPEAVWHNWYPFFPLVLNRMTGQLYGVSDVRLQMPLQDEINLKRTHEREAQKAAYPRWVATRGTLLSNEKAAIENALPYKVVEVEKASDILKNLIELPNSFKFDPRLYDISKAKREIDMMSGIPQLASGGTGDTELATEAAIANQQMGVQADRRKNIVEDYLKDIYICFVELAIQIFPEDNIKQLIGEGAVWPTLNREQLWHMLSLEIMAGSAGKPDKGKDLSDLMSMVDIGNRLGLVMNGVEVFKRAMEVMDMPGAVERYVIGLMPPGGAPGAPGPDAGGGAGKSGPNNGGGGAQPGAGAPPMSGGPIRSPQQIPNGPASGP